VNGTMDRHELLAGVAEVDITPPVGVPMDGYIAREGNSVGVHDPLLAQALLLRLGDRSLLLYTLDLIGVRLSFTERLRAQAADAAGVRETEILLACSHTHSGPAGLLRRVAGFGGEVDAGLQEMTLRNLVGAARWAANGLEPAQVGVETGCVTEIGRNRNDPEAGPIDSTVTVLRVDDAAGEPLAVMMNYGCHPTVLGHDNREISADFPGAARRVLKGVYPRTVFLFTNGAAGDVSTRFTRRAQTFDEVRRLGRILAGEVLHVLQLVETISAGPLSSQVADLEVDLRELPPRDVAEEELEEERDRLRKLEEAGASHGEIRRATTRVEGAEAQLRLIEGLGGRRHVRSQVQVVRIGDLLCVGMPGEPFARLGLDLKEKSSGASTAVISYANDDIGYFPDQRAMADGTYEALASPFGREGVAEIRREALSLMRGSWSCA